MPINIKANHFENCGVGIIADPAVDANIEENKFQNVGVAISIDGKELPPILLKKTMGILTEIKVGTGTPPTSVEALTAAENSGLSAWAKANGIALAQLALGLIALFKP